ncbi:hypothetical protein FB451DRAFT_1195318 [Mycena latifolia]|nr:hypothetical protein FB451DRAFT_1195318 [Mycena latifolia]
MGSTPHTAVAALGTAVRVLDLRTRTHVGRGSSIGGVEHIEDGSEDAQFYLSGRNPKPIGLLIWGELDGSKSPGVGSFRFPGSSAFGGSGQRTPLVGLGQDGLEVNARLESGEEVRRLRESRISWVSNKFRPATITDHEGKEFCGHITAILLPSGTRLPDGIRGDLSNRARWQTRGYYLPGSPVAYLVHSILITLQVLRGSAVLYFYIQFDRLNQFDTFSGGKFRQALGVGKRQKGEKELK